MKPLAFRGTSLSDLRAFPESARRDTGYQLHRVQCGLEPSDWRPMNTIGPVCAGNSDSGRGGAFRVIYVARFRSAVYVLHCFQKKTQKTSRVDLDVAAKRYADLVRELGK